MELGSERVDHLFDDPTAFFFTANLTLTELTSALDRKVQDGTVTAEAVAMVMAVVAQDFFERIWLIDLERITSRKARR
ncbi:MAG: type II toxin-antitoxin system VapC family toxin [Nitrospira sp.]|nr:MAG: type II toxin-antitoxin system VapC family toxin [Nitrospira sp.]